MLGGFRAATAGVLLAAGLVFQPLAAMAEVLQTQMGVNGMTEADVVKAQVSGNVLTVAITFRNTSDKAARLQGGPGEFYFVDAAGKNKYLVLRDSAKRWLAGPLTAYNNSRFDVSIPAKGRALIWLKFPAPPADSPTINLTTPFTLPFDNLKVRR
ncbi:MAG TPA: hypothetical protein ENK15_01125 [Thermopetrobacter sp.]|nr:hypothetical protein [Thermopetrobacter sp.]